jgi:lysyl-tRNA synthetase class 2
MPFRARPLDTTRETVETVRRIPDAFVTTRLKPGENESVPLLFTPFFNISAEKFALLLSAPYNWGFIRWRRKLTEQPLQHIVPDNDQTRARREHLEALRELVGNVYPNKFARSNVAETTAGEDTITSIVDKFKSYQPHVAEGARPSPEVLEAANDELNKTRVRIAGRIASPPRVMGKAAFVHLSDGVARLQIYVRRQDVTGVSNDANGGEVNGSELFNLLDHGDFIGVEGYLFVTKTGELSVHVEKLQFLAKALLPMPDKMHGINDPEIRQRQRYADLIAGSLKLEREENEPTPREVFELRSKVIREIRRFLEDHGYIEVETPMLTPLATGAAARPFKTHHNALDIDLFARIAPELYLKRLVVGGFEKVYELNRNFRNEGIDRQHNPEFTMLEFYWAYADVNKMMDFCEELLRSAVYTVIGHTHVRYGIHDIDFSIRFDRLTMKDAIGKHSKQTVYQEIKELIDWSGGIDESRLDEVEYLCSLSHFIDNISNLALHIYRKPGLGADGEMAIGGVETTEAERISACIAVRRDGDDKARKLNTLTPQERESLRGAFLEKVFAYVAEPNLTRPTFIHDFPKAISPLSKASPGDPAIAERFEFFVGALETANGFSELNDPAEQYQRFSDQVQQRERGDEEAMVMDEDYIRALSYGMPPAAGIGIGIDRFVMLLANRQSIRDVILFPHRRPEQPAQ